MRAAPLAPQLRMLFSRREAPVWLDASTTRECREIEAAVGGADTLQALTGSPAYERFTGPQIRKFHKDAARRLRGDHAHSPGELVHGSLLIGANAPLDPGDASGMNLMDLRRRTAGRRTRSTPPRPILLDKLPPIRPSWESRGAALRRTGKTATHFPRRRS